MVCLKNNDRVVSDEIHSYGSWERDNVMKVMRVMEMYPDAVFIGNELCLCFMYICVLYYKMGVATLVCIQ